MRGLMKRLFRFGTLALLVCLGLLVGQTFASSTVHLTFVNVGPGNIAPTGVYAYPYNFSINGSTTLTPMMCDSYNNHIGFGESWTASVHGILQGGMFATSGQALMDYRAAGLIFLECSTDRSTPHSETRPYGNFLADKTTEIARPPCKRSCRNTWASLRSVPTAHSRASRSIPRLARGPATDLKSSSATIRQSSRNPERSA